MTTDPNPAVDVGRFAAKPSRLDPPSLATALGATFALGSRELVLSKKTLVVVVLGGLLVGTNVLFVIAMALGFLSKANIPFFFGTLVTETFLRFFLPVVSLFYGAAIVTDEIDGRTLTYLTTRPIDKRIILWGKFLAFFAVSSTLLLCTLGLSWLSLAGSAGPAGLLTHFHLLAKDSAVVVMGILTYGSLFTLLGALFNKPVLPGLIYIYIWEQFASFIPGSIQRLTVLHYLQSITPHTMTPGEGLPFLTSLTSPEHPAVAVLVLLAVSAAATFTAGVVFRNREYRLEK